MGLRNENGTRILLFGARSGAEIWTWEVGGCVWDTQIIHNGHKTFFDVHGTGLVSFCITKTVVRSCSRNGARILFFGARSGAEI